MKIISLIDFEGIFGDDLQFAEDGRIVERRRIWYFARNVSADPDVDTGLTGLFLHQTFWINI
jgi:hypothetical protein